MGCVAEFAGEMGDAVPQTPGIFRFGPAPAEKMGPDDRVEPTVRPVCSVQAPVGARVASPQSPILNVSQVF